MFHEAFKNRKKTPAMDVFGYGLNLLDEKIQRIYGNLTETLAEYGRERDRLKNDRLEKEKRARDLERAGGAVRGHAAATWDWDEHDAALGEEAGHATLEEEQEIDASHQTRTNRQTTALLAEGILKSTEIVRPTGRSVMDRAEKGELIMVVSETVVAKKPHGLGRPRGGGVRKAFSKMFHKGKNLHQPTSSTAIEQTTRTPAVKQELQSDDEDGSEEAVRSHLVHGKRPKFSSKEMIALHSRRNHNAMRQDFNNLFATFPSNDTDHASLFGDVSTLLSAEATPLARRRESGPDLGVFSWFLVPDSEPQIKKRTRCDLEDATRSEASSSDDAERPAKKQKNPPELKSEPLSHIIDLGAGPEEDSTPPPKEEGL
jgi:hypothetical protein